MIVGNFRPQLSMYTWKSTASIPYSRKLWRALNLVNQSSECIGEFLIWWSWALSHRAIMCEIILAGFKFGNCSQNCQFAKLKTSPKFPAIQYTLHVCWTMFTDWLLYLHKHHRVDGSVQAGDPSPFLGCSPSHSRSRIFLRTPRNPHGLPVGNRGLDEGCSLLGALQHGYCETPQCT